MSADRTTQVSSPTTPRILWKACGFVLGLFAVWIFLEPVDATSVFDGTAQPQNLLCIGLSLLVSVAVALTPSSRVLGVREHCLVGVCLLWLVIVSFLAGQSCNPRTAWNGFWQVVALGGCYYASRCLLVGTQSRSAAVAILLAGCLACSSYGIYQVAVDFPAMRAEYAESPEEVLSKLGLEAPPGSPQRQRFENRLLSPEPYSTFALANSLATVLSACILLLLGLAVMGFRSSRVDNHQRSVGRLPLASCLIALAIVTITWYLTRSRTSYLAVIAALTLWFLATRQGSKFFTARTFGIVACVVSLLAGGVIWFVRNDPLVLSEAPKSIAYRLEYWSATASMLLDHGITGVGLGNFQSYYPQYMLPSASESIADPHNFVLDIAVTLSVPIAGVLIAWILVTQSSWLPSSSTNPGAVMQRKLEKCDRDTAISQGLLLGACIGGVACLGLLSALKGFDAAIIGICWSLGGLLSYFAMPLIHQMVLSQRSVLHAASLSILLCLLASGSWQASGIAVPFLLLSVAGSPSAMETRHTALPSWFPVLMPLIGLVAFVFQSWMPTNQSWVVSQQISSSRSLAEQLEVAKQAAKADPLNAESLRIVAFFEVQTALSSLPYKLQESLTTAQGSVNSWLNRDSVSFVNWQFAGDRLLDLAAAAKRQSLADSEMLLLDAVAKYRGAVERNPSYTQLRLQLAAALALAGQSAAATEQLAVAEKLSSESPHEDKKLLAQIVWIPQEFQPLIEYQAAGSSPQGGSWLPAEPIAAWIRKLESRELQSN